ncbi:unnamed protein product [Polarella glacialis]|uniref:Pentatricopeptide repeat-containing protein n=1 Tax=Polarella glacialis TaxID=89957 RepID=A0A813JLZ5_POLGL|nr:unnamed protein product [Polarella glacialis]
MQASLVEVNVYHCSAAVSAGQKVGHWQLALNLLSLMPGARVVSDEITYSAAISACEKGGQWHHTLNLLRLMPEVRVVPDRITYSAAVSACGKGGQMAAGAKFVESDARGDGGAERGSLQRCHQCLRRRRPVTAGIEFAERDA